MHLNEILAQAATTPATPTGTPGATPSSSPLLQFAPMILLVIVFYFVLIRPQSQRTKQQRKLIEALKPGDKVATSSGIVGVVITVKDKTVSLRSADAKMEVTKSSVTEILQGSDATES